MLHPRRTMGVDSTGVTGPHIAQWIDVTRETPGCAVSMIVATRVTVTGIGTPRTITAIADAGTAIETATETTEMAMAVAIATDLPPHPSVSLPVAQGPVQQSALLPEEQKARGSGPSWAALPESSTTKLHATTTTTVADDG